MFSRPFIHIIWQRRPGSACAAFFPAGQLLHIPRICSARSELTFRFSIISPPFTISAWSTQFANTSTRHNYIPSSPPVYLFPIVKIFPYSQSIGQWDCGPCIDDVRLIPLCFSVFHCYPRLSSFYLLNSNAGTGVPGSWAMGLRKSAVASVVICISS